MPALSLAGTPTMEHILATIRGQESGDYSHPPNAGGASGAYQFIQSTWTNAANAAGFGQYAGQPAYLAPPAVQDAVAADYVSKILAANGGNVEAVPLTWYYPAALGNPALMDQVPSPGAGNRLTPRQYAVQWMNAYNGSGGSPTVQLTKSSGSSSSIGSIAGDYLTAPITAPVKGLTGLYSKLGLDPASIAGDAVGKTFSLLFEGQSPGEVFIRVLEIWAGALLFGGGIVILGVVVFGPTVEKATGVIGGTAVKAASSAERLSGTRQRRRTTIVREQTRRDVTRSRGEATIAEAGRRQRRHESDMIQDMYRPSREPNRF